MGRLLVCLLMLTSACSKPKGEGRLAGVAYRLELVGDYRRLEPSDHEHVWIPADPNAPIVVLRHAPRPQQLVGGKPVTSPCPAEDRPGGSAGGLLYTRSGALRAFTAPSGQALVLLHCLPPGEATILCTASFDDGELSGARKETAMRACRSLRVDP